MKLKIRTSFNYFTNLDNEKIICKFYTINTVPFTYDELPKITQDDPAIIALAEVSAMYTAEDLFKASNYLIMEEAHPLMFEVDLENPELLPAD